MTYREAKREFDRAYWSDLLERHQSVSKVAEVSGTNRTHVYRRLKALDIELPENPQGGNWALHGL